MKKLIPLFVVLAAGIASAEWKLNPYTQRQDYYESKAAVVLSTGTLQVEIDALHVATTTLTQNLATEVSDRTIADAAIAVSTGTLTTGLASEASARQAADLVIGLTTASLRSDLTTEANNRTAGDSAVGASTGTLGVRVTAAEAALSTAAYTTASYANPAWITSLASSKIDFSTITTALAGKLSNTATVPPALVDLSTVTTALAGKQPTGNYITALTGDVTASGPGSAAATVVNDSHTHGIGSLTGGIRTSTDTLSGDVTGIYTATVVGNDSHSHTATTISNFFASTQTFSGDVTGTYAATVVGNDSHDHALNITGNAAKATLAQAAVSLSNEPTACTAGQYATDISSMGVLTCGTPAGAGDMVLAATQTVTGAKVFQSSVSLSYGGSMRNSAFTLPTRHTVIAGTTTSAGYADFLNKTSGLFVHTYATAADPIVIAFAAGHNAYGPVDYIYGITASSTNAWALAASTTTFLGVNLNATNNTITYVKTVHPLTYGYAAPSCNADRFFFSIPKMKMNICSGGVWVSTNTVFVGEAISDGSNVTSVITYALNGQYISPRTAIGGSGTGNSASHNIGVPLTRYELMLVNVTADGGWSPGEIYLSQAAWYQAGTGSLTSWADRLLFKWHWDGAVPILGKGATMNFSLTMGRWEYFMKVMRGF